MDVDADELADALADRLAAIVPDGFHVRAADGMLWYSSDAGRFPGQMSDFHVGASGIYVRDNLEAHDYTAEGAVSSSQIASEPHRRSSTGR